MPAARRGGRADRPPAAGRGGRAAQRGVRADRRRPPGGSRGPCGATASHPRPRRARRGHSHIRDERGRPARDADLRQLAVERARLGRRARVRSAGALALLPAGRARRRPVDPPAVGDRGDDRDPPRALRHRAGPRRAARPAGPDARVARPRHAHPPARRRAARAAGAALGAARRRRDPGCPAGARRHGGRPGRPDVRDDRGVLADPDERRTAVLHARAPRRHRRDPRDGADGLPDGRAGAAHRGPRPPRARRARSPCSAVSTT